MVHDANQGEFSYYDVIESVRSQAITSAQSATHETSTGFRPDQGSSTETHILIELFNANSTYLLQIKIWVFLIAIF